MEDRRPLMYGMLALAVALGAGLMSVASAVRTIRVSDQVTVTGSAKRPIRSDFAVWRVTIALQHPSLAQASQDVLRAGERFRAFLKREQVPDSAITVRPLEAGGIAEYTNEGRETGRILASRVSQTFEVRLADVDAMTRIAQNVGSLISEGVPLTPAAPEYLYTNLAAIRIALLEDATKDARARAEAIIRSTGGSIGNVSDAKMGVFQITPRFSTEISDYGVNDVSSVDKDVTAVVRATFAIK
jgi:hypothetical protein